jgi:hypothetical protein
MSSPGLEDLASRLVAVVQALLQGNDPDAAALESLFAIPSQVADRVQTTRDGMLNSATNLLTRARDLEALAVAQLAEATKAADDALARATEQADRVLKQANDDANRAVAAADRGLEQAKATGDAALDEAAATREKAVKAAEAARAAAVGAAKDAKARADQLCRDAKDAAQKALDDAEQAVAEAEAKLASIAADAQQAVDDAIAAAQQLPGEATALATDALRRLEGALSWPSGILSLMAKALQWLKDECFPAESRLQVVWHQPAAGPHGLGLQWLDGAESIRVVYRPPEPPAVGAGTLLIETMGSGHASIGANDARPNDPYSVKIDFDGADDQQVIIGKGLPAPAPGAGDVKVGVTFGALKFDESFGPLRAVLEKPTLTVTLAHEAKWSYDATLALPKYGASLSLSDLLAQVGIPIPITVPSIGQTRSLQLGVADGRLSVHEGGADV